MTDTVLDETALDIDWSKYGRTPLQTASTPTDHAAGLAFAIAKLERIITALEKPRLKPDEALDQLAERIAAKLSPHALWDLSEVAKYLHRSEQHTRQWVVTLDGFPKPLRIPSGKVTGPARARPMWRSKDVIGWAEDHIET